MAGLTYTIRDTKAATSNNLKGPFHIEQYNDTKSRLFHHVDGAAVYTPSSTGDAISKIQIVGGGLADSTAVTVTNLDGEVDTMVLLEGTIIEGPFKSVEVIDHAGTTSTMNKLIYWEKA